MLVCLVLYVLLILLFVLFIDDRNLHIEQTQMYQSYIPHFVPEKRSLHLVFGSDRTMSGVCNWEKTHPVKREMAVFTSSQWIYLELGLAFVISHGFFFCFFFIPGVFFLIQFDLRICLRMGWFCNLRNHQLYNMWRRWRNVSTFWIRWYRQDAEVDAGITACKEKSYSTDAVAGNLGSISQICSRIFLKKQPENDGKNAPR